MTFLLPPGIEGLNFTFSLLTDLMFLVLLEILHFSDLIHFNDHFKFSYKENNIATNKGHCQRKPKSHYLPRKSTFFCHLKWKLLSLNTISNFEGQKFKINPPSIYLFKVRNRNTRKRCEISLKSTIKTAKNDLIDVLLVFLLLTSFWCFYC